MGRLIDADALIDIFEDRLEKIRNRYGDYSAEAGVCAGALHLIRVQSTIEPERKTDIIQKFHDYQIDWLKSHYDIELEPQLEEMIVRFLHDTANCYMPETDREEGEQDE